MEAPTIALFCCLDDFAKLFEDRERHHLLPSSRQRWRHGKLSLGEMLFIMVLFHISPYKDFKHFRFYGLRHQYRDCFGELPSYSRFMRLMPGLLPQCPHQPQLGFPGSGQAWSQRHGLVLARMTVSRLRH